MTGLTSRDRRTLVVGLVTCGSLILLARGIPAWKRWLSETRAEAAELQLAAAHAEASLASRSAVSESLSARRLRLASLDSFVVPGATPAAAAGELSAIVSAVAEESNVALGSLRLRVDTLRRSRRFVRVAVTGAITGDVHGVMHTLAGLEEGLPALAIRDLAISQPEPGAPSDRAEALRLDFTVEGLAVNPAPVMPSKPRPSSRRGFP